VPETSICAIVVTYNPDQRLLERIDALAPQVDLVIVVDNASSVQTIAHVHSLKKVKNLELIENLQNLGLGAGFNIGLQRGLDLGYEYLAIFDQDSFCSPNLISELHAIHIALITEPIALVSPTYHDETLGIVVNPDPFSHAKPLLDGRAVDVMTTFSSASLIRANILKKIGLMNEEFFIDYIDHEFCLRCHSLDYRVLQSTQATLKHRLGNPFKTWAGFSILEHNSDRIYYQSRNRILMYKKFSKLFPGFIFRDLLSGFARLFEIFMYQNNKIERISSFFLGTLDGLKNRAGRRKIRHYEY
jgi:rhamnosyltransferase